MKDEPENDGLRIGVSIGCWLRFGLLFAGVAFKTSTAPASSPTSLDPKLGTPEILDGGIIEGRGSNS